MRVLRILLAYIVSSFALLFSVITLALASFAHWLQDDDETPKVKGR